LPGVETGRCLEIGQGAGDNANVDAIEQATESSYQQEEPVVARFFVGRHLERSFARSVCKKNELFHREDITAKKMRRNFL
jgi:hypothetical protein